MEKKARLGRGLDALLGDSLEDGHADSVGLAGCRSTPSNPHQPRRSSIPTSCPR